MSLPDRFGDWGNAGEEVTFDILDTAALVALSWLTILGSGLARRCDLHVPGSRELDLHTNPGS
jgi:hypothetical protein